MDHRNHLINPPMPSSVRANRSTRSTRLTRAPLRTVAATMLAATLAALSLALLAGCGGGGDHGDAGGGAVAGAEATSQPVAHKAAVDFRLESEYGPGDAPGPATTGRFAAATEAVDRSAAPVDRQARTRRGRYISRAAAERTNEETGGQVVWVDASCCAGLDPELPARIAFGMQAVLGNDAPLFVSGNDLRQAARLVDRLDALGIGRVHLVTP